MPVEMQPRDVREKGFADRASVDEAIEWIDQYSRITDSEEIALEEAVGRILAQPFVSPMDVPQSDTAMRDGYAVRSCETIGASNYNPLPFCLQDCHAALRPYSAALVTSGTPLPPGSDAVAPFDLALASASTASLIESVAQGEGVNRKGEEIQKGTVMLGTSRPLRASDIGFISSFGIERVLVIRRPLVRIILAGCKSFSDQKSADTDGPMLRAEVVQDGGLIEICKYGVSDRCEIAKWIGIPGADVVLVCGRTGTGPDDDAPLALEAAGTLSIHGIAVRPGDSTGMGTARKVPVVLLPGSPLDCFCAYQMFAGRLIRNLSGRSSQLPYRVLKAKTARKIVSSIGTVELCRVRLENGEAIPLGAVDSGELTSVVHADGFILIPATLEGYAPGTPVSVYTYDEVDEP